MWRRRPRVAVLTFVTREGCTLCAEALPVVRRVASRARVSVQVHDVDVEAAFREWSDHVPVVLLDGVEHSRWWVDADALKRALRDGV